MNQDQALADSQTSVPSITEPLYLHLAITDPEVLAAVSEYPNGPLRTTPGRIARNIFAVSNNCASQRAYKRRARELGLAAHGAPMPLALARKLVRFLSDVGQLVADPFGGSMTTPLACEIEERPWIATETVYDYVRGGAERFTECPGFSCPLDT